MYLIHFWDNNSFWVSSNSRNFSLWLTPKTDTVTVLMLNWLPQINLILKNINIKYRTFEAPLFSRCSIPLCFPQDFQWSQFLKACYSFDHFSTCSTVRRPFQLEILHLSAFFLFFCFAVKLDFRGKIFRLKHCQNHSKLSWNVLLRRKRI